MKNSIEYTLEKAPGIFKAILIIGVVVFISFLLPNNVQFKYDFEQGQTWRYDDLSAPFDFPIKKTDEEISKEKERIKTNFAPYYVVAPNTADNAKQKFKTDFKKYLEIATRDNQYNDVINHPNDYLKFGINFIEKAYSGGIIEAAPKHSSDPNLQIFTVNGNTVEKKNIKDFKSIKQVKDQLTDELPESNLYESEFLLFLKGVINPNITYSDSLTNVFHNEDLSKISRSHGMVEKGELIIKKDGIVTADIYQKLVSYKVQFEQEISENKSGLWVFLGYFLLAALIMGVFVAYLWIFSPEILNRFVNLIFVLIWFVGLSYLVFSIEKTAVLSVYMIPFVIVPIIFRQFFSAHFALFSHIIIILIASFLSSLGYEFTVLQILAGFVAVLWNTDTQDLSQFFKSILFIFLIYALTYLGLSLVHSGNLKDIDWHVYIWLALNAFLTLLAFPLVPLLERLFGFTSSISLVGLTDMNRPLLRELALKTPGTLQHSLQVGNLAEAASNAIGAKRLLVKVGALYHDIGKINNPDYFIENLKGKSPHDDISAFESAKMIIAHVTDGVKIAKKHKLPKVIIDFILTHHGTTRVEYFYRTYMKENPGKEFDETLFRYPGPNPQTKEHVILMLADSLEAASKSLKNPTGKDIDELVENIIDYKIDNGQLDEADITFKELEICKNVFKKNLRSINHVRIEYPEIEEKD